MNEPETASQRFSRVLDALERGRQRATYGAVAAHVGVPVRFLMARCPCDHRHSWIVNKKTLLPTGYDQSDMHPDLRVHDGALTTQLELDAWLRAANGATPSS